MVPGLVLRDADVDGRVVAVRVVGDLVAAVGPNVHATSDDIVIDAGGGALLRGLHDHHMHVHTLAAAWASVPVGPPAVTTPDGFRARLAAMPRLADRCEPSDITSASPVTSTGMCSMPWSGMCRCACSTAPAGCGSSTRRPCAPWAVSNAPPISASSVVSQGSRPVGCGGPTTSCAAPAAPLDLAPVGDALARVGVTAITDATATNDRATVSRLAELPQRVRVMGPLDLAWDRQATGVRPVLGEVKVLLDDDRLPPFDGTIELIGAAHGRGRGVAFHCVTLVQLQFALAALRAAGVRNDRIEHASVAPPDAIASLRELGLVVSVQPSFVAERGDDYLGDVDPQDIDALYPLASLERAGVRALGSTDAPYTTFDPWRTMRAAVDRCTPSGAVVGPGERITPRAALALFGADQPVVAGIPADLVLLRVPLANVLARLESSDVTATIVAGKVLNPSRS